MNLRKAILIEVFTLTDQEIEARDIGIDVSGADFDDDPTERRWFYTIDSLFPEVKDDRMCCFYSSGFCYIAKESIESLKQRIDGCL